MQRQSPPKHRHDGTSPLPLGMDWSPPPKIWAGRETIWPHNPRTGWSYCAMIPSWVVLAKSRESDPIVFYRVLVGLQSPEGITSTRVVLRRFNDFLKFLSVLKKLFPRKSLAPAPPKGFLRMKSRALLEERRSSLEEWMAKLLSDIDVSRSVPVASFLELEAAARSSFQDENSHASGSNPSLDSSVPSLRIPGETLSGVASTSSLPSDYGSDTAYETSDVGSPRLGRENISDLGTEDLSLDEDLTSPIDKFVKYGMSNIDEGLFMGQTILEQLGNYSRQRVHPREINSLTEKDKANGTASKPSYFPGDTTKLPMEPKHGKTAQHARKLSAESIASDTSSQKGSELSGNIETGDLVLPSDVQLYLPSDQRHKMNRLLSTMQRRLMTAKTDMEDLISRLNQETAVKDYLTTKVKDLEVELDATKQKSKENLEQAILIERERVTQMQWDMEELLRKSMEMELKLNSEKDKTDKDSTEENVSQEKDTVQQELDLTRRQLEELMKQQQELEVKSKADIKVLVKEIKSLRSSQAELKQQLNQSLKETSEAEKLYEQERQSNEQARTSWGKFIDECEILRQSFDECNLNNVVNLKEDNLVMDSSCSDALNLLTTFDNQINLLRAQVRTDQESDLPASMPESASGVNDSSKIIENLRRTVINVLVDNGKLKKQVNSVIHRALEMKTCSHRQGEDVQ